MPNRNLVGLTHSNQVGNHRAQRMFLTRWWGGRRRRWRWLVACGRGCDEGPRKRLKASSGTEGSSRGPCCAGRADGNNSTDGNVQSSNNGNKRWVTTENVSSRLTGWKRTPQRRRLPPRETRQWSIRTPCSLSFQTDARFSNVVETSACNKGVHCSAIYIGRHLQEACETNRANSWEG